MCSLDGLFANYRTWAAQRQSQDPEAMLGHLVDIVLALQLDNCVRYK